MTRDDAIQRLRALEPDLRARGISALFLFGSMAREEHGEASDIDVLFEESPESRLSLFGLVGIRRFLKERMGADIDLIDRRAIHFMLRDRIEAESIPVFA